MTYSLSNHFYEPHNVGDASEPSFTGRAASVVCGANVRTSIEIDGTQRIRTAKFKCAGCSVLVTTLSVLTDEIIGKTTAEAAAIAREPAKSIMSLADVAHEKTECVSVAGEALLCAIRSYSDAKREDWLGSDSLICTCFCVSEQTITREVMDNALSSVAEVTRVCGAGGGCGSCHPLIQDVIDCSLED
jgi:NifU-like protein